MRRPTRFDFIPMTALACCFALAASAASAATFTGLVRAFGGAGPSSPLDGERLLVEIPASTIDTRRGNIITSSGFIPLFRSFFDASISLADVRTDRPIELDFFRTVFVGNPTPFDTVVTLSDDFLWQVAAEDLAIAAPSEESMLLDGGFTLSVSRNRPAVTEPATFDLLEALDGLDLSLRLNGQANDASTPRFSVTLERDDTLGDASVPVPLPAAAPSLLAGLGVMGLAVRRRHRRGAHERPYTVSG